MQEKAKAEEEARVAVEKASEAAESAKKLEQEVKKLSQQEARAASLAQEAQEKAEVAGTSVENLLNKAKDFGAGFSWEKLSSQITTSIQKPDEDENPKVQLATVRGQAKARNLAPNKAVVKQTPPRRAAASKPKEEKPKKAETAKEVRNVFGGLFKQETIYVDDD